LVILEIDTFCNVYVELIKRRNLISMVSYSFSFSA
jgi:hypothetical protein